MNLTENNIRNFWKHVSVTETCWLWTAHRDERGYGIIRLGSRTDNSRCLEKTHRLSWIIHFGEIPKGLFVLHHCDNPPCLNPRHLHLGTAKDNIADMLSRGRQADTGGEKNGRAKLTRLEVDYIRSLHAQGGINQRELADMFGAKYWQISRIIRRINWK